MKLLRWLIFPFLLVLDIVSKILAIAYIPYIDLYDRIFPFGGIPVFSDFLGIDFSLNYVVNTGAAWGFFSGHSGLLFSLRAGIILALLTYLLFFRRSLKIKFPLCLVLTGAIGNAIDYCVYGHVIDFLHFVLWGYSFPIFNIADSCITIGVFCLFLFSGAPKKAEAL